MNWALLQNSLLVSGGATLLALGLGFVAALWLAGLGPRWRQPLLLLAMVGLVLPPFLVTNCWLRLLGANGLWRRWLPLNIYSLAGAAWILALLTWPIALLLVLSVWQRLEAAMLESEPALTGGALIRWLLWPLARGALGLAAVVTFVLALNNFAVPAILQVKVFPAELWINFNTHLDAARALAVSWPLLAAPAVLLVLLRRTGPEIPWRAGQGAATAAALRRQLGPGWFWSSGLVTMAVLVLTIALPALQIIAEPRTWTELPKVWPTLPHEAWNTFWLAAATASLCLAIGLAAWRWPLQGWLWWPFLLPGVFLAIGLIYLFNRPGLFFLYRSAAIVLLAWTIRYAAVAWTALAHAMRRLDRELIDAARLEGATRWDLLRYAQWPQVAPQARAAWYLTFLLCLWDVETLILIYPPGGETLALRIFNLLHYGHTAQVNALCLVLLGVALAPWLWLWLGAMGRRIVKCQSKTALVLGAPLFLFALLALLPGCSPPSADETALPSRFFRSVQIIGTRGTALGQFNKPRSLAVDRQDNLYVVDMTARVQKFSPQGALLGSWQLTETDLGKPKGMCLDARGNIVVLEPHYSRVNHFTHEGRLLEHWGVHGTNDGELAFPRAVVVNSKAEMFVSEYGRRERVQCFADPGKKFLRVIGRAGDGPGEFNRPEGLGLDAADRLYVADSCNHRIQVFSPAGRWLRAYGRPGSAPGQLSYPYDVRVDARGCQFVCEFGNSRIQVFDARDQAVEIIGGPGAAPGRFNNPWSLALDSHGNLYVADAGNHRVQKLIRKNVERQSVERRAWNLAHAPRSIRSTLHAPPP